MAFDAFRNDPEAFVNSEQMVAMHDELLPWVRHLDQEDLFNIALGLLTPGEFHPRGRSHDEPLHEALEVPGLHELGAEIQDDQIAGRIGLFQINVHYMFGFQYQHLTEIW